MPCLYTVNRVHKLQWKYQVQAEPSESALMKQKKTSGIPGDYTIHDITFISK